MCLLFVPLKHPNQRDSNVSVAYRQPLCLVRYYQRLCKHGKIPQLSISACTVHLDSTNRKLSTVEVISCYPSRSVVYNAVGSGPAAVEFTLWKWEWLAKNCPRVQCWLKLSCLINPLSLDQLRQLLYLLRY